MNDEQLKEAGISAGLIRISCGLEDKADLIADIEQALAAVQEPLMTALHQTASMLKYSL